MNKIKELQGKLKLLENKAIKKGWITGRHIFHYLDETDMHIYINIDKEIAVEKTLIQVEEIFWKWIKDPEEKTVFPEYLLLNMNKRR